MFESRILDCLLCMQWATEQEEWCRVYRKYTEFIIISDSWLDPDLTYWPAWGAGKRGRSVVLAELCLILLETYSALTCHDGNYTATGGRISSLPESGARLSLIEQHSWTRCRYTHSTDWTLYSSSVDTRKEDLWSIWCVMESWGCWVLIWSLETGFSYKPLCTADSSTSTQLIVHCTALYAPVRLYYFRLHELFTGQTLASCYLSSTFSRV